MSGNIDDIAAERRINPKRIRNKYNKYLSRYFGNNTDETAKGKQKDPALQLPKKQR